MAEDTRRPVRRPQRLAQAPKPNASLYVGYVEDDESVDSIMRKFSELEKIERKAKRQQDKCTPSSSTALSGTVVAVADAAVPVTEQGLATSSAAPCVMPVPSLSEQCRQTDCAKSSRQNTRG
ncbi:hypothetical protein CAOG_07091 [Capsaspora owczarzaki ATCC 30864]|uniref:Uncharacterized protein n=1 Tax=Capsaspora owczarzaki (strain ATCC 30864) TaxID=595528 RepID=A0A0D2X4X7_CAPO3|nr:hypothetical protein CAOG_07091 [Capsaspora owczarzaki ATCC 30864]KJE96829.1 hypothetical protein CAOG_007091 [Capsaspora owczarzaki ATCC 30864]|eukprot:XP_004343815.1 hypothetical protein CAOG_07091 [Capsaspora owczarzaki ATCC 30864]